jgi:hypothetical protein
MLAGRESAGDSHYRACLFPPSVRPEICALLRIRLEENSLPG